MVAQPTNLQYIFKKVEKLANEIVATVPDEIQIRQKTLDELRREASNYLKFISLGNMSKMVADSLIVTEGKISSLEVDLHALEQTAKNTFICPSLDYIKDASTHFQGILEARSVESAQLLRKILGPIRLKPVFPEEGKPYLLAQSKLQTLMLIQNKRPQKGPLAVAPDVGSNAMQWWRERRPTAKQSQSPLSS